MQGETNIYFTRVSIYLRLLMATNFKNLLSGHFPLAGLALFLKMQYLPAGHFELKYSLPVSSILEQNLKLTPSSPGLDGLVAISFG